MWILIRWLHQKPADLNLHCFQKRINPVSAGQGLILEHVQLLFVKGEHSTFPSLAMKLHLYVACYIKFNQDLYNGD